MGQECTALPEGVRREMGDGGGPIGVETGFVSSRR